MVFFSALREEMRPDLFHLKTKAINLTTHLWMRAKVYIWGLGVLLQQHSTNQLCYVPFLAPRNVSLLLFQAH